MTIISWNCCGKFRVKYKQLMQFNSDILVIQECEDPTIVKGFDSLLNHYPYYVWRGNSKDKGLGIFSKRSLMELEWESHLLTHFIPVSVDNCFVLLGVWACGLYIDGYAIYQSINSSHFNKDMVIIGDFNSNTRWDYKGQRKQTGRSHSDVVNWLQSRGLISAYHNIYGIEQGKEIVFTFYLYRHKDKGSHIDYCFVSADKLVNFTILDAEAWLNYSDHIPIIVNVTH